MAKEEIRKRIIGAIFIVLFVFSVVILILNRMWENKELLALGEEEESISIITATTKWKYMEEGKDPSVGNVWTTSKYDASFWKDGQGSFCTANETVNSYFFRCKFNVDKEDFDDIQGMKSTIEYSDAVMVYLNGNIIYAGNIPPGGYRSNLEAGASEERSTVSRETFSITELSALKRGENILAVEVHKAENSNNDMHFSMPEMELCRKKPKESGYNTENLFLLQGSREDEIYVKWLTDSSEYYRVEYLEESRYRHKEDFSKYGKTVYMGRKRIGDTGKYVNGVSLTRLKENTKYVYRIIHMGGKKASDIYRFDTGRVNSFSFGVIAGADTTAEWEKILGEAYAQAEDMDFFLMPDKVTRQNEDIWMTESAYQSLLKPEIVKEVPLLYVGEDDGSEKLSLVLENELRGYQKQSPQGNSYITYQDTVIIRINTADNDDLQHKRYIENVKKDTKRAWVIVTSQDKAFVDTAREAGADFFIGGTGQGEIAVCDLQNEESKLEEYTFAHASIRGNNFKIECYDTDDKGNLKKVKVIK